MNEEYMLLTVVAFLWIGWSNWKLHNQIEELEEQIEIQHTLITNMADELNKFGSPNVKKETTPVYNIHYE
jgi:archaellum component FlaC